MTHVRFDFECWEPFGDVEVWADGDSNAILLYSKITGEEVDFDLLRDSDRSRIKALAKEHLDYHRDMESKPKEPHPAEAEFGSQYVDWINKGCP